MNKETIIAVVMVFLLAIVSIHFGYYQHDRIELMLKEVKSKEIATPEECRNLSMQDAAYCLNTHIASIFKYKIRPDEEEPTLEELIEEGGDCANWANLYVSYIEDLGFYGENVMMLTGNNTAHVIAIISDETGYCILDQRSIECFELVT